jgi:hypothetical protein
MALAGYTPIQTCNSVLAALVSLAGNVAYSGGNF